MAIVEAAARTTAAAGTSLRDEVMAQPEVRAALEESAVDELFDPASHLGVADQLVDRVIARLDEGRP
jgi:adenylosuccinate lyase